MQENDQEGMKRMSDAASRKKGVIVSTAYIVGQVAVNLVYVPLLLTTIGQDEYGLYQLVGSIVSYIAALNGVLSAGVGRFYSKYKAEDNVDGMDATIATANVVYNIVGLIAVAISFLLIPMVRVAYSSSLDQTQLAEMGVMLVILALNTVVSLKNTITTAVLQANEEFLFWKGSRLAFLMIQPVFVLGAVTLLPNALMVTIVIFVNNITCSLAQRSYCVIRMGLSYRRGKFERRLAKSISVFFALGFAGDYCRSDILERGQDVGRLFLRNQRHGCIFNRCSNLQLIYVYRPNNTRCLLPESIRAVSSEKGPRGNFGLVCKGRQILFHAVFSRASWVYLPGE